MANYKAGVRFNIDPVSKKISTPYKDFRLVRDDTNSVVLSFRMPRFISGVDMSECENVKIFYKNIDPDSGEKHEDSLPITDLIIGEGEDCDYVFFSYKITPGATKYAGLLIFAITFRMGEDAVWSTEPYDGIPVGFRFETSESIKENVPPDLLEAWKSEIIEEIKLSFNLDISDQIEEALTQAKESGDFKGDKGDKGDDGKDYVLTEADKEEIAEIAAEKIDIPQGEQKTEVYWVRGGNTGTSITTEDKLVLETIWQRLSVQDFGFVTIYGAYLVDRLILSGKRSLYMYDYSSKTEVRRFGFTADGVLEDTVYPSATRSEFNITNSVISEDFSLTGDESTIGEELSYINENFARKTDIPSGGIDFTTNETLNLDPATNVLSVNTATEASAGSMLPITSGAVYALVGNVETLLSRI